MSLQSSVDSVVNSFKVVHRHGSEKLRSGQTYYSLNNEVTWFWPLVMLYIVRSRQGNTIRGSGADSMESLDLDHSMKTESLMTETQGLSYRRLTIRGWGKENHFQSFPLSNRFLHFVSSLLNFLIQAQHG